MKLLLLIFVLILFVLPISGQIESNSEEIQLEANDGLILVGDFYSPEIANSALPTVLLLHMLNSNRIAYEPLIPYLLESGYNVLNVDIRGHGATRGRLNWIQAEADIQIWFDWLRQRADVDGMRIAVIGASIGANLAIRGCFNDGICITAVAISPGEDYRGIQPMEAIENGLNVFLIASRSDTYSVTSVKNFFASSTGEVAARIYIGSAHGTDFFRSHHLESLATEIIAWLQERFAA